MKIYHLDLKITMLQSRYIKEMLDYLRSLGFDGLMIEVDNKIIYKGYQELSAPDAMTTTEWNGIVRYARDIGYTVYPMLQTLGHMQHILIPGTKYTNLAEIEGSRYLVCPSRPGTRRLLTDMMTQLKEVFENPLRIGLGGDECGDLGSCPLCSRKSRAQLLYEHMAFLSETALALDMRPEFWADMVLAHPDAVKHLPGETVFVDWDYNRNRRYTERCGWIRGAGYDLYEKPIEEIDKLLADELKPLMPYIIHSKDYNNFYGSEFLKAQGYDVVLASAVRFHGQNYALPRTIVNIGNVGCTQAVSEELKCDHMVTSWSVRMSHPETTWVGAEATLTDQIETPDKLGTSIGGLDNGLIALLPDLQTAIKSIDVTYEPNLRFETPYADKISETLLEMSRDENIEENRVILQRRYSAGVQVLDRLRERLGTNRGRKHSLRHWISGTKLTMLKSQYALTMLEAHEKGVDEAAFKRMIEAHVDAMEEFKNLWRESVTALSLERELEVRFKRDIRLMQSLVD